MAHDGRCGRSVLTPRRRCTCSCVKNLHGVPHSERASAFYADSDVRADRANQAATKFRRRMNRTDRSDQQWGATVTDFVCSKLVEEAIGTGFEPDAVLGEVSEAVSNSLADSIRAGLFTGTDADVVEKKFRTDHMYCALCVLILEAVGVAEKARDRFRDEAIEIILTLVFGPNTGGVISAAARGAVRGALVSGFDAGIKALTAATPIDAAVMTVRFLGIASCPDVDRHPEDKVAIYCMLPLAKTFLGQWLLKWIGGNFAGKVPADA